ncbi:MAG: lysophospholipid acyltransferase family protein [Thermodesulfobacteriota bacterium]
MVVRESIFRDILRLFVWFPLRWAILILPVRLGILILATMGDIHRLLSRNKKEVLAENLLNINSSGDGCYIRGAIKEYYRNHYIDRLFIFIFPRFAGREVKKFVEIEGLENLDSAIEKGKGAILVHGHFGPVHLPLVALARLGYPMKQIGLPSDEGLSWTGKNVAFRLRLKYEAKIPAEIIKADAFLRPAFRWLKSGGAVMITGDGTGTETRVGRHGEFRFFGQRVYFPLGPALLAQKTGATLLPMFVLPGIKMPYRIIIGGPLGGGGAEKVTAQFVKQLEDYVSKAPGYMHFLDRFRPGMMIGDVEDRPGEGGEEKAGGPER